MVRGCGGRIRLGLRWGSRCFGRLWIAAVISYTGTWMQNVGAGWLMTQLTTSPLMVSLVQAAAAVPVFLVVSARGSAGGYGRPAAAVAVHARMDGGGVGGAGRVDAAACGESVGAAGVYVSAGAGRGDERSGVAGDYAGCGFSGAACFGGGVEFGGIQCGAGGRSGAGRNGGGGGGIGVVVSSECGFVLWRDFIFVQMEESRREKLCPSSGY